MQMAALFFAAACGCAVAFSDERPSTTAPATTRAAPGAAPAFAPIAYYEESCSRCHGQAGTGYPPDMGQRLGDAALRKVVKDMAEGPAAAALDEAQVDAETAYHRSLAEGTPFIWRRAAPGGTELAGEVTPGATVSILIDGKTLPAAVEGHTWSASVPPGGGDAQIIADREGKRTTLEPNAQYSHSTRTPSRERPR